MNKLNDEKIDFLFKGILTLENIDECYSFFEDLCTVAELQEMSKRLLAAKMLKDNYIYTEIAEKTGLSTGDDQPRQPLSQIRQRRLYHRA